MRTFAQLQSTETLRLLTVAERGTGYIQYDATDDPIRWVRHFDQPRSPRAQQVDALTRASLAWLERSPVSDQLVIEPLLEVGTDFVAGRFCPDVDPLCDYDHHEDDLPPLPQLPGFRRRVRDALPTDDALRDALERSLLGPAEHTYYDAGRGRFVVAELEVR